MKPFFTSDIVCACSEVVMKSMRDDSGCVRKIRSKILIIKGNDTYAVCRSCGTEVAVPLELKLENISDYKQPALLLRR